MAEYRTYKIPKRYWYETPLGTFDTWEEAAARLEKVDLCPCLCIKAYERNEVDE